MNFLPEFVAKFNSLKDPFEKSNLLWEAQEKGINFKDIAKALKVNVSYLSHLKRLKRLPEMLVDGYYAGSISLSHLFVVSRLKKEGQMIELYERILRDNLTVQETEAEIRKLLYQVQEQGGKYFPKDKIDRIKKLLKEFLPEGIKSQIIQTRVKVKVILEGKGNLKATGKVLERLLNLLESIRVKDFEGSRVKDSL